MQEHVKIYTGMSILTQRLKSLLTEEKIPSLIKDDQESGRLAGFGTPTNATHLFVLNTDLEKAQIILNNFKKEIAE